MAELDGGTNLKQLDIFFAMQTTVLAVIITMNRDDASS